ncbi:MAG: hypothetical protein ABI723_09630 [Bacteroidia bacterium]
MNFITKICNTVAKTILSCIVCILLIFSESTNAQSVGIGASAVTPSLQSILDVQSNTKGILIPRMTDVERVAIAPTYAGDYGLLVYQTNTVSIDNAAGYWYWDGTIWISIGNGHNWSIDGNAGTNPNLNFIGTTDANDFVMRTDNTERARIAASGNFGIGTVSPTNALHVEADGAAGSILRVNSTTDNQSAISLSAPWRTYRIGQNRPPDNPGYTDGFYIYDENANATRLYVTYSGDVGIGTVSPSQKLSVSTGMNVDNDNANNGNLTNALIFGSAGSGEGISSNRTGVVNQYGLDFYAGNANRMSITNAGNVGIGTSAPYSKLEIQNSTSYPGANITNGAGNTTDGLQVIHWGTGNGIYNYTSGITSSGYLGIQGGVWPNLGWYSMGSVVANLNSGVGVYTGGRNIGVLACAMEDGNTTTDQLGGVFYTQNSAGSGWPSAACIGSVVDNIVYKVFGWGIVSTVVLDTTEKPVVMAAPEAPEALFQDYGTGKLSNGKIHINIDPVLTKNITVDEKHPIKVFIQLNDNCNGVFVNNKSANGFDVEELNSGTSNANFSWMIVATRKNETRGGVTSDYESFRFKRTYNAAFNGVAVNH